MIVALEISLDLFFLYNCLRVGHGDKQDFMLHTRRWPLRIIIMTPSYPAVPPLMKAKGWV